MADAALTAAVVGPIVSGGVAVVCGVIGYLTKSQSTEIRRRLDNIDERLGHVEEDDRRRLTRVESILDLIALPS